jgi:calcineurin-like phosphoesterase family protein
MVNLETYIIADTHFGHTNISKYETIRKKRAGESGFANIDDLMIYNWNNTIKDNDTIFHLGDFAFKHSDISKLSQKLNGKKILLIGNHDKPKDINILRSLKWNIIDTIVIDIEDNKKTTNNILNRLKKQYQINTPLLCCYVCDVSNKRIMFTHFPLFNDNPYDTHYKSITKPLEFLYKELRCDFNIHGHTHSHGAKESFCISACVEKIDFKPKKLKELIDV